MNKTSLNNITESKSDTSIKAPRWDHWRQRKLARPWQATLLGMGIEPSLEAKKILSKDYEKKYEVYKDRMDILKTLIGYEIEYFDSHVREGIGAKGRYISLLDYYNYFNKTGWDLNEMFIGLRIEENPPIINQSSRKHNNIIMFLDDIFCCLVDDYCESNEKKFSSVKKWLHEIQADVPVSDGTLRNWINEMSFLRKPKA